MLGIIVFSAFVLAIITFIIAQIVTTIGIMIIEKIANPFKAYMRMVAVSKDDFQFFWFVFIMWLCLGLLLDYDSAHNAICNCGCEFCCKK